MHRRARPFSRGATTVELLVAFSLLTTVLGASLPLVVRHGRILVSARHYRLALDELSNQVERLTALAPTELPAAIERLEPSPFTARRLPGAKLKGRLDAAEVGKRLTLEIVWDEPQRRDAPVVIAAWIPPDETAPAEEDDVPDAPREETEP